MSVSASSVALPVKPEVAPFHVRPIAVLTSGHLVVDLCQGLVPALVPYLVKQHDFSLSAAGGLVLAASALSSVVQPLFGQLADRSAIRHLLPMSILLAGLALGFGAQIESYPFLVAALLLSGLGIAAFHPEAARRTFLSAGPYRTTAMSYFSLGGSIGFAIAPVLGAVMLQSYGRLGLLFVIPVALLVAACHAWEFRQPVVPRTSAAGANTTSAGTDDWTAFWKLSVGVITRSIVFFGINSFLVLFWEQHWGTSLSGGTTALAVFLFSGVAGTLIGGWFADRIGRRAVLQLGFGLSLILFPLVFLMPDANLGLVVLGLAAAAFFAPSSPSVVLGQEYLPNRVGVASGVTIGLAVSTGGMVAPLLGRLGDMAGLTTVFGTLEALLVVCFLSTLILPAPQRTPAELPSAEGNDDESSEPAEPTNSTADSQSRPSPNSPERKRRPISAINGK